MDRQTIIDKLTADTVMQEHGFSTVEIKAMTDGQLSEVYALIYGNDPIEYFDFPEDAFYQDAG